MSIIEDWALTVLLGSLSYFLVYHPNFTSPVCLVTMSAMLLPHVGSFFLTGPSSKAGKFLAAVAGPSFGNVATKAKDELISQATSADGLTGFISNNTASALESVGDKLNVTTLTVINIVKTAVTETATELQELEDVSLRLSNWLRDTIKQIFGKDLWVKFAVDADEVLKSEDFQNATVGNMTTGAQNAIGSEGVKINYIAAIQGAINDVLSDTQFLDDMIAVLTSAAQGFRDALSVAGTAGNLDPVLR